MPTILTRIVVPQLGNAAAVAAVTRELKAIRGTNRLTVRLQDDGDGVISILSNLDLSAADLTDAVQRAGFSVQTIESIDDALAAQMAEQAPARQASRNAAVSGLEHLSV